MAIKHSITLSTTEPNNEVGVIKIRQADEQTQMLDVQITENGVPKSYTNLDVYFCAKLGQTAGLGIIEQKLKIEELTDPVNGKLVYTMRAEDWQILGRQKGYFSFRKMKDEHEFVEQFTTRDFTFDVIKSVYSDGLKEVRKDGSTYVWTIEELIRLLNEYIASGKTDWEEFVEQNRELIEGVDPGGEVLSELIRSRKPEGATEAYKDVPERLDKQIGLNSDFRGFELSKSFMQRLKNEMEERGINVKWFGVKMDGVTNNDDALGDLVNYVNSITDFRPVLYFPPGTCKYTVMLHFKREVLLLGESNSWLEYDGTGIAIKMGPDNLTYDTYPGHKHYGVKKLGFKNSPDMDYGIYFNKFVTQPLVDDCNFENFGGHNSWSIYFDEEVWFGLVSKCRFDNERGNVARQFVKSARFGNNQIWVIDSLVHSLSGIGTGIFLNGVNSKVTNCKVEGFATDVRLGSAADASVIELCYFESAGAGGTGTIELGEADKSISTRGPRGVTIKNNYANIHLLANDPRSRFVKVSNDAVVIRDLNVIDNYINDYNDSAISGYIIELNNVAGNKDNRASNNTILGTSKIINDLPNSEKLVGSDSNRVIHTPKVDGDTLSRTIAPNGKVSFDALDNAGTQLFQWIIGADKSASLYVAGTLAFRVHASGQISFGQGSAQQRYDFGDFVRAPAFVIAKKHASTQVAAGSIYEDNDGELYYINVAGVKKRLT